MAKWTLTVLRSKEVQNVQFTDVSFQNTSEIHANENVWP